MIIPCFNGERYLGEALAGVLAQTHTDLEVIVVDDGSTDRSPAIAEETGDRRLRLVRQANAGVAAARNRGAAEATGEFVAFLDQDDRWLPEKIERQLACLRASPEVGLVYTDCFLIDDTGARLGHWAARHRLLRGRIFERLIVESVVPISTVLLPRSTFQEAGGFGERYRFVEDLDLLLKVAARRPIEVVETPHAEYRLHPGSTTQRLGLEVAAAEMVDLCEQWITREPARAPAVSTALARYLYTVGKTALYQGDAAAANRYLALSLGRRARLWTRMFRALAWRWPGLVLGLRAAYHFLRR